MVGSRAPRCEIQPLVVHHVIIAAPLFAAGHQQPVDADANSLMMQRTGDRHYLIRCRIRLFSRHRETVMIVANVSVMSHCLGPSVAFALGRYVAFASPNGRPCPQTPDRRRATMLLAGPWLAGHHVACLPDTEIPRPVALGQTARRRQLRGQPQLDPARMLDRPRSLLIPCGNHQQISCRTAWGQCQGSASKTLPK